MGLRGAPPKPTVLKLLEGNRGRRPLNKREPQPEEFKSTPPQHLDEAARTEWKRLSSILKRMKVLTEADYIALGLLCQAYSTGVQAQTELTKTGLLYRSKSGYIQQNPLVSIVQSSMDTVTKLLREFGLTPSSRTRVVMEKQDKTSESSVLNNQWAN